MDFSTLTSLEDFNIALYELVREGIKIGMAFHVEDQPVNAATVLLHCGFDEKEE